ncbi:MAG: LysR family transcriptional regulator [Phascolarctobacterium sp.]|uniref:LysR family transcriptional regulator n=1 Tax=Phascolarctobacterium sp. TaxID=2049039 RepID=UPI0025E75108|nr:LysR family transcriptional regulator [Phascolarctobacterium sp.]MCC8157793.1 LysR family transcriptional regulator [Phascolarctobacterium sp.]
MIKQIKYFQAVVRCRNFTEAAESCYISQSAISQQIQSLERELGVKLIKREKRSFSLTPAGEFFYKKSLVLVNDFDKLCLTTRQLGEGAKQKLTVGYLKYYRGRELESAVVEFVSKFPKINLRMVTGTHEELYEWLRTGQADLVISDLRRKPSDLYVNYFLTRRYCYAEIFSQEPLAQKERLTMDELKNMSCIIVASKKQEEVEIEFYREYLGVKGDFLIADSLAEAHLMVISRKGYLPVEFTNGPIESNQAVCYIPLICKKEQIYREYYAFWLANRMETYLEDFAAFVERYLLEEEQKNKK